MSRRQRRRAPGARKGYVVKRRAVHESYDLRLSKWLMKERRAREVFAIGAVSYAGTALLSAVLSNFGGVVPFLVRFFTGIGVGLMLAGLTMRLASFRWPVLFALPMFLSLPMSYVVMTTLRHPLFGGGSALDITLAAVPAHAHATAFTFRDGTVRPDLQGVRSLWAGPDRKSRTRYHVRTVYAVPVVPDGWTPDQPVGVWAVADEDDVKDQVWTRHPRGGGLRVNAYQEEIYPEAIEAALIEHHLSSVANPLLLEWSPDPEALQRRVQLRFLTNVAIGVGIWSLLVRLAWWRGRVADTGVKTG